MNIKRSINKRIDKLFGKKKAIHPTRIINLYQTTYNKNVLVSYITTPFTTANHFTHQNYLTSHLIAESFSEIGYNVDIIDFFDTRPISYEKYSVIFGFGKALEQSFYFKDRSIPRIHFVTGAHHYLQNEMSLKSIKDFYQISGLWLANEANVLSDCNYYSIFNADFAIMLAHGHVYKDYQSRFEQKVYSLNNNILNAFSGFKTKDMNSRSKNFLFLSGAKLITKGLHILLEVAKIREDLNFFVVVPHINNELENYYSEILNNKNVFLHKGLRMDSEDMKNIVESCSYCVAPSYIDGLPGGIIEPMSAGLIPIVSKFCGFSNEEFIFEMEDLSPNGLNDTINKLLTLDDTTYINHSNSAKEYACEKFSSDYVKHELLRILKERNL